ncbi:MAG: RNA polymerase sigma factor [Bacteroidales bacterium]
MSGDDALEREFEERLRESSSLAFRVAYGVLRHREDAEDVAQEAFAKAHRAFAQLRDREKFRAWLVRMTWRLAIDWQRSHRRRIAREQVADVPPPSSTTEQAVLANERARHLWQAIDALPQKLRVVIVLAGIEEYDVRAVAELLDVPEGTVKSRLFLARKDLAERLRWLVNDSPAN